jgi:hypothetical protein
MDGNSDAARGPPDLVKEKDSACRWGAPSPFGLALSWFRGVEIMFRLSHDADG